VALFWKGLIKQVLYYTSWSSVSVILLQIAEIENILLLLLIRLPSAGRCQFMISRLIPSHYAAFSLNSTSCLSAWPKTYFDHMFKNGLLLTIAVFLTQFSTAQHIQMQSLGRPVSIRGLSVVNDQVIWVSGSGGNVGLSRDGGYTWKWILVPGHEHSDFRDIEAFSDQEAVIMGITQPAVLMRTVDGGSSWETVFEDTSKSVFLDAMDFSGEHGVLIGDPKEGKIWFAESLNRGKTWEKTDPSGLVKCVTGEAFFAASGSNVKHLPSGGWVLVSGGKESCLYLERNRHPLLLNQGGETTGANSIAINPANPNQAFVAGGDFSHDTLSQGNGLQLSLNPFSQQIPKSPPRGYRSCVEYIDGNRMICCGTSGVDISTDGGLHWKGISEKSFHVCSKAKSGAKVFLAGAHGAIALLKWD
jgi:hypothetical protein